MTCNISPLIFRYEYRSQVLYYGPTLLSACHVYPRLHYNGHRYNACKVRHPLWRPTHGSGAESVAGREKNEFLCNRGKPFPCFCHVISSFLACKSLPIDPFRSREVRVSSATWSPPTRCVSARKNTGNVSTFAHRWWCRMRALCQ